MVLLLELGHNWLMGVLYLVAVVIAGEERDTIRKRLAEIERTKTPV